MVIAALLDWQRLELVWIVAPSHRAPSGANGQRLMDLGPHRIRRDFLLCRPREQADLVQ
jgi:hypothetical protein